MCACFAHPERCMHVASCEEHCGILQQTTTVKGATERMHDALLFTVISCTIEKLFHNACALICILVIKTVMEGEMSCVSSVWKLFPK